MIQKSDSFSYILLPSHFGQLAIVWQQTAKGQKVHRVFLPKKGTTAEELVNHDFLDAKPLSCPVIDELSQRIQNFLKGEPIRFELDIIVLEKCSDNQKKVFLADYDIPRGCVSTYGKIAKHLGMNYPRGAQNAGTALKENPFPIIFPCHRVIKSDGDIGDYQGGIEMKRALLEMEGVEFLLYLHEKYGLMQFGNGNLCTRP